MGQCVTATSLRPLTPGQHSSLTPVNADSEPSGSGVLTSIRLEAASVSESISSASIRDRRTFEERQDRYVWPARFLHWQRKLGEQQRVAAERNEMIMDTYMFHTEYARSNFYQRLLSFGGGCNVRPSARRL